LNITNEIDPYTGEIFPLSEEEQKTFTEKQMKERIEKNRQDYLHFELLGAIRGLKWEHSHLPMIGVEPLSKEESVELNNLMKKAYDDNQASWNDNETLAGQSKWKENLTSDDIGKRGTELLFRASHDYVEHLFGEMAWDYLEYEVVRNGRVECADEKEQKRRDEFVKSNKETEFTRDDSEDELKEYNKKYDKWGMKRNA
jgi:hypothetical protein